MMECGKDTFCVTENKLETFMEKDIIRQIHFYYNSKVSAFISVTVLR